jgi:hypothetical protein
LMKVGNILHIFSTDELKIGINSVSIN